MARSEQLPTEQGGKSPAPRREEGAAKQPAARATQTDTRATQPSSKKVKVMRYTRSDLLI